jgi:hypothetical protein
VICNKYFLEDFLIKKIKIYLSKRLKNYDIQPLFTSYYSKTINFLKSDLDHLEIKSNHYGVIAFLDG